jgi:hypothetical protein
VRKIDKGATELGVIRHIDGAAVNACTACANVPDRLHCIGEKKGKIIDVDVISTEIFVANDQECKNDVRNKAEVTDNYVDRFEPKIFEPG